eukprot:20104-Heterococcus_DN1.PRE.1
MPKKSSKKGSKKQTLAAETAMVPHRAPNLTHLLERTKGGKLSDVQQYLDAGGSTNVLVETPMRQSVKAGVSSKVSRPTQMLARLTLLAGVAGSQHSETVASIKLLLHAGAAVDALSRTTNWERTALMLACSISSNLPAVQALLEGGADPCYQIRSDGLTALHFAATMGYTDYCRALHTASSGRALELQGEGEGPCATPLIAACAMEQYAVVKLLCAPGADVNHSSASGNTPLMTVAASKSQDTSILHFLLQQDGIKVDHLNFNDNTALMEAVDAGTVAAVKLLLEHSADVSIINKQGFSPVFAAVAGGHLSVLKLLMQHGADVTALSPKGLTLLMQATINNLTHIADFLISQGLSVHAVDDSGCTALHHAASRSSDSATMRVLLAHGADVNAVDVQRGTPLHCASQSGHLDKVDVLIAAGADVIRSDALGATALHVAIHFAHLTIVKLLLEHGADVVVSTVQFELCTCCDAMSALMMCEDTAILKLLLTAGADVHAVTSSGDTCLHIAARHNYSAPLLCLLIKAGADIYAVNSAGQTNSSRRGT